ncbi:MAG: AAA family ATPase [Planctomycetia bacterium]|nr:AAA family ATPase [Planctomycetia bacterium]
MARILLTGKAGNALGELPRAAEDVLAHAENHARAHNLAKRSAFQLALRQEIEAAGFRIADAELAALVEKLEAVRRGDKVESVSVSVSVTDGPTGSRRVTRPTVERDMPNKPVLNAKFFEAERTYPDARARGWYDRLVGIDEHKRRLLLELELLLYPERLSAWSQTHHGQVIHACAIMASRAPLVLLEGDVGCGKTVLAETIGDPLADLAGGKVHLLKVNTQVRGTGMVGEMTDLIVQAFTQAEARADALGGAPLLLLIDEADALAAKRVDQHMHHEDKAGLNTLLQRIDSLRLGGRRMAVLFITNRPDALDPAVRRRAALQLTFRRPDDEQRTELIRQAVPEIELSAKQLRELVLATGAEAEKKFGASYTWSDITDRLIPSALREAYTARRPLTAADLLQHARDLEPTPAMGKGE